MSIELHVYAPAPLLTREQLASELLWPELPDEFKWEIRFLDGTSSGPLSDADLVAWHPDSPQRARIEDAVRRGDDKLMAQLAGEELLAWSSLGVVTPADGEEWKDVLESALEDTDEEEHQEALREAAVFYSVETSARRNDLSLEFQTQLWRMIGVLAGGLSYDPQEGEFELLGDEEDVDDE